MAEIIDNMVHSEPSLRNINSKANAGLTTGIIGTALGILGTGVAGVLGLGKKSTDDNSWYKKQCEDFIELTKQYYEGKAETTATLNAAFFDSYKRDVENRFNLYENQRNEDDAIKADMNSKFLSFYQLEQSDKNDLEKKLFEVEKKVDIMAAIRPYQDALIDKKIDENAIIGAYELQKRTCRMIQGELVLPSTPTVTGYPSYTCFTAQSAASNS